MNLLPSTDYAQIKKQYRLLAQIYHPDKRPDDGSYNYIQDAHEILKSKKRIPYDRFGPDIKSCTHCKTLRDYLVFFSTSILTFYLASFLVITILSFFGGVATFWRFLALFSMFSIELFLLVRFDSLNVLYWFTSHEKIQLLHQLFPIVFLAQSQLSSFFTSDNPLSINDRINILNLRCNFLVDESVDASACGGVLMLNKTRNVDVVEREIVLKTIDMNLLFSEKYGKKTKDKKV